MARDTDRLLQSLAQAGADSMRYAQMQAQREAQDQATGIGLHEAAARRTDMLGQQAAQMGAQQQARGDDLAARAADLEMRKAHQAEVLAQRVAEMQERGADRDEQREYRRGRDAALDTQHKESRADSRSLRLAEIAARKELKQTPPAPRPGGSGMGFDDRAKLVILDNAAKIRRDAYSAKPGKSYIASEQAKMDDAYAQNKMAADAAFQAQVQQVLGRKATPEEVDELLAAQAQQGQTQQPVTPPTPPAVTGGAPVPKPWAVGKTATSTQR